MTCLITHVDTVLYSTVLYCTVHVSNDVSDYLIISPGCCRSAVDAQSQPFMDCHALDEEANDCYNNNYNLPRGIPTLVIACVSK